MKYRTEVVREGEKLGPVDWSHPFIESFGNCCGTAEYKQQRCDRAVAVLRQAAEAAEPTSLSVRCGDYWYNVWDVGMYDGWPYWKPMPAVMVEDRVFHTAIWKFFYDLDECATGRNK